MDRRRCLTARELILGVALTHLRCLPWARLPDIDDEIDVVNFKARQTATGRVIARHPQTHSYDVRIVAVRANN